MTAPSAGPTDPFRVRPTARLRGRLSLPGDKSISHRALLLATLAAGDSRLTGAGDGEDVRATAEICRALGAEVEAEPTADGRTVAYTVHSPGADGLTRPPAVLDCRNSGTSLRLTAGILASLPMEATLDGDASLRRRPVARIIEPLRSMGAVLHARGSDSRPPVTVVGRTPLRAIEYGTPVPSAQVKSAILLAALRAEGVTRVREDVATRDHTERMLRARGIPVETVAERAGAVTVSLQGGRPIVAVDEAIPGDVSAAAFWLVAGTIHPDADLTLVDVGVNPTRRGIVELLRAMGADIEETPTGPAGTAPAGDVGEPLAELRVRSASLRGIDVDPQTTARIIDEVPIVCLAATQAIGRTTIRGAGELRIKESDRLAGITAGLRSLGARIQVEGDDVIIDGQTTLHGAVTDPRADHRLVMTFAIAGLLAAGETIVPEAHVAAVSYPPFFDDLAAVAA